MKRLELWRWRYFDPVRKKHCTTRYVLSEADAPLHYPSGATKVERSLEVRMVPETDDEIAAASTSAFQRTPCPVCLGARWVCEDPSKPWPHEGCGGAGSPCVCNPRAEVEWAEVYAQAPRPDDEPLQ